jgi:hypothetical protein
MASGLSDLVGKDIHTAMEKLGSPSDRRVKAGETLYIWSISHDMTIPQPPLPTVTGVTPDAILTFTMIPQPRIMLFFNCTIELDVDSERQIKSYRRDINDCE